MNLVAKARAAILELEAERKRLEGKREKLLQRKEFLESVPLPKDEVIAALCDQVDANRQHFAKNLYATMRPRLTKPMQDLREKPMVPFFGLMEAGNSASNAVLPINMVCIDAAPLKAAITAAVESWEYEAGPAYAERVDELEKLAKDIAETEALLDELFTGMQQSGVRTERKAFTAK